MSVTHSSGHRRSNQQVHGCDVAQSSVMETDKSCCMKSRSRVKVDVERYHVPSSWTTDAECAFAELGASHDNGLVLCE